MSGAAQIDFSFDQSTARGMQGGLNRDTMTEEVPRCLCWTALPNSWQK